MNLKKFKRLACAALSFSMLLSMNVPVSAIDLKTAEKAENGNVSVLATLAAREETTQHAHSDANGNPTNGDPVWSAWDTKAEPGCEKPGYKMRQCTVEFCYEVEVEELPPVGHNYNEGTIQTAPTCQKEGVKLVTCQNDEKMHGSVPVQETVEIPKVPHDFTGGTETTIAPTCKTDGQIGTACRFGCGTIDEASKRPDAAHPATGHSYKSVNPDDIKTPAQLNALTSDLAAGITANKVTCTSAGSLILECKNNNCDGTDAEKRIVKDFAATGHTYDKHLNGKDLNDLTDSELQALTTATDDGIKVTAATCEGKGSVSFDCQNTWDTASAITKEIPALGHDWDEGTVTKPAQCETEGIKTSTCERCDTTSGVAIKATGHSFGNIDTSNVTNDLLKELAADPDSAKKGITAQPATCITPGSLKLKCNKSDCDKGPGAEVTKTVNATGHNYDNGQFLPGQQATCLKDGTKTYTCQNEGCTIPRTEVVKASGHSYGEIAVDEDKKEVTAAALKNIETNEAKGIKIELGSCTETGKLTLTCKNPNCDDKNVAKEYTILTSEHDWAVETYRAMTCMNDKGNPQTGMNLKTCKVCGIEEWEVIPVKHAYEAEGWFDKAVEGSDYTVITDRTCTTDGKVKPVCNVCKKNDAEIVFPRTGHSYDVEGYTKPESDKATQENLTALDIDEAPFKAATCTSAGYQYYICKNEGKCTTESAVKLVKKFDIEKTNHPYSENATTRAATCTKPGGTAKFCQTPGCDAYDPKDPATNMNIPATGHSFAGKKHPSLEEAKEAGIEGIETAEDLSFKGDCLTDGYDYYICTNTNCDRGTDSNQKNYIEKIITKAPGQHDMKAAEDTIPATCTHPEQMHKVCSRCDYDEVIPTPPGMEGEMEPMLDHDYAKVVRVVKDAICEEGKQQSGIAEYGCVNGECGTTVMKVLPAEHQWKTATAEDSNIGLEDGDYVDGDTVAYKAPNCNADGHQYKKCTVCKKVVKEPITKLTHTYTEKATADEDGSTINEALSKASTCKVNGYEYYRCTQPGCEKTADGHYEKRTLPLDPSKHNFAANGHTDPTCVNPELNGSICTICGTGNPAEPPTTGAPALGHVDKRDDFSGDYTKLPLSTLEELKAENIDEPIKKAATCTQSGYEYRSCTGCAIGVTGHAIKVTLKKTGHDYDDDSFEEIPSTCTRPGLLVTTCKICGARSEQEISSQKPLGHDFQKFPREESTCVAAGKTEGFECTRCGESDTENPTEHPARQPIPVNAENHVWEKVEDERNKAPNCADGENGTPGTQVYKCKHHKDAERVAVVPPVHQWEDPVMQNCVNGVYTSMPGLLYHVCGVCDKAEVMKYLTDCMTCTDPSHATELANLQKDNPEYRFVVVKPKTLPAQAPTCTADGKTQGKQCSCDKILIAQEPVSKIPHAGELVIKDPGNCGKDGIKQHKCDTCGSFYGAEESFTPEDKGKHKYEAIVTDPSCKDPMKVQEVCTVCGHKEPVQEVVGTKLPHTFEDGKDTCSVCGAYETEVATSATTSSQGGNTITFVNDLSINNTKKVELLEAGVIYYMSQSLINAADTKEKLEELLNFETGNPDKMKVGKAVSDKISQEFKKFSQPIMVGSSTNNKIAARAYIKVKVGENEEYRYGDVIVRSYNEVFYPAK